MGDSRRGFGGYLAGQFVSKHGDFGIVVVNSMFDSGPGFSIYSEICEFDSWAKFCTLAIFCNFSFSRKL
jgi:hypothetical protein